MFSLILDPPIADCVAQANKQIATALDPASVNAIVGRATSQLTQNHLYGLANSRHRPNVGLNFYEDAGDATSFQVTEDGAEIRIDKTGVAQRYFGGDIEPVNRSHLWLPVEDTAAEGKAPGEFWPFDHIVFKDGKGFASKDLGQGQEILFWLVNHVHQDPDPTVLPSEEEYQGSANAALALLIDAPAGRSGESTGGKPS